MELRLEFENKDGGKYYPPLDWKAGEEITIGGVTYILQNDVKVLNSGWNQTGRYNLVLKEK